MIKVDFRKINGRIKPLHGVNNAARENGYGDLLPDFKKLHVPFSRLHDTRYPFGCGKYVDIPCIFKDFDADADDPASYDFYFTDMYIKYLVENGIEVMYRLGVTIEHAPKKYYIYPPASADKWADIAEHIVRHYNDGWADGFRYHIKYWEIWNEPDGDNPDCETYGRPMWEGTHEEYYTLYSKAANRIKKLHPDVLVGGYSSCFIMGSFHSDEMRWIEDDAKFFRGFLDYITAPETKAPLDFFSWHGYLGDNHMSKIREESEFVDRMLKEYGLGDTLRFDTEWNVLVETEKNSRSKFINMRNHIGASNIAGALFEMQRCKVDGAMFYDAQLWCNYGPLFELPSFKPTDAYRALLLFNELYSLGQSAEINEEDGVSTIAATDGAKKIVAVANLKSVPYEVEIDIGGDNINDFTLSFPIAETKADEKGAAEKFIMPPHSVAVLKKHD